MPTNNQQPQQVHVAEIVRYPGQTISLPEGMSLLDASGFLRQKAREEEEMTQFHAIVATSPYDGANALYKALNQMFGFTIQRGWRHQIQIRIDHTGKTISVPWGEFEVPGIEGKIETGFAEQDGFVVFQIDAELKGKYRQVFNELVELTRQFVTTGSIYRGKALSIEFTFPSGRQREVPEVKFVDTTKAFRPIFSDVIEEQLDMDVFSYLTIPDAIRLLRGSLKRGVLLAGPYGTGKTLTALYSALLAIQKGFTYIYVKPQDLPYAIDFARAYQPAVVFAEDVETVAKLERTDEVNLLLNKMDGLDTKGSDVVVIFTTNHADLINPAMLRPGRIDVVVSVEPPDAKAAIRLARHYSSGNLTDEDYTLAGEELAGLIPALIQDAVARAQIRALTRTRGESSIIGAEDLVAAAKAIQRERALLDPTKEHVDGVERLGTALGAGLGTAIGNVLNGTIAFSRNGHDTEHVAMPTK